MVTGLAWRTNRPLGGMNYSIPVPGGTWQPLPCVHQLVQERSPGDARHRMVVSGRNR